MEEIFEMTADGLKLRQRKEKSPNKMRGICEIIVGLLLCIFGCVLYPNSSRELLFTILSYVLWGIGVLFFLDGVLDIWAGKRASAIRSLIVRFIVRFVLFVVRFAFFAFLVLASLEKCFKENGKDGLYLYVAILLVIFCVSLIIHFKKS